MVKIPENVQIPTAKHPITEKPALDATHITTQGFLQPQPIFIKECVPNQRFDVTCESFTRLNPMPVPTFGRARVNNRAFFVPMRTIMPHFNEFIEAEPVFHNATLSFGLIAGVPVINNTDFVSWFNNFGATQSSASDPYDYIDDSNVKYFFNNKGRFAYKLLLSLGYQVFFDQTYSREWSALPLLAFSKVFLDWMYPSQYANDSVASAVQALLNSDAPAIQFTDGDFDDIVNLCMYCTYDDDYFVSAWDRPVAPNSGAEHSVAMIDVTNNQHYLGVTNDNANPALPYPTPIQPTNGTPHVASELGNDVSYGVITQYVIDTLKSLTDYTKRHQMAGVRAVDRYLAEYGINLSSEIMKRSIYLGADTFDINFMDVMSMSDTSASGGDVLGSYAGKGIGYGRKQFSYDLGQEFGYFIIVNSIIPDVGYYQGIDKSVVGHVTAMDFYHGDFDNQGVQAIAKEELYMPVNANTNFDASYPSQVFAFIPRFAEYKVLRSRLSGLYTYHSSNLGMDAYYLYRDCSANVPAAIGHDINFVRGKDYDQYNRMFYGYDASTEIIEDQFNFIHHFTLKSFDDLLPLWDTYEFHDEDKHAKVNIHPNGSKLN